MKELEHPQVQKGIRAMVTIAIPPNGGIVAGEDFAVSVHSLRPSIQGSGTRGEEVVVVHKLQEPFAA